MSASSSPAAKRVLLVEDEPGLVVTLTDRLKSEGYQVSSATDGGSAIAIASKQHFDVILLDVMLPGVSGFDVCRDLRQQGVKTPIIMLTARGQVMDKVLGLKIGADDYLTKPFDMLELLARVEVQLRRASALSGTSAAEYRFGDVTVNFRKAEVVRAGTPLELSAREFLLLKYFIEHREATLTRDVAHQLIGLSAILQLHFRKEEDVLLPVLDASLDTDAVAALFARMREVAHP